MQNEISAHESSPESGTVLARVAQHLAALEKRDWEEWLIAVCTGVIVMAGLLALIFPAAFTRNANLHFEINVPKELYLGLIALLVLFNTYMASRRLQVRRMREQLISTTIQSELVRLQSFTDPLTEVYNRRSLQELAHRFFSHACRSKTPLTFLVIDVDQFKDVNTRFGHLTGDFVLAEIAGLLKTSVRGSDAVVRYGGDEFLIILSEANGEGAAQAIARISKYVADWNRAGHLRAFELQLSIGMAEWEDGTTLDQVLDRADQNMYRNKEDRGSAISTG